MNPITFIPAVQFLPGEKTVDVPIPHDAGGQAVTYTVTAVVNTVADLRETSRMQFVWPAFDAADRKGVTGFTQGNVRKYGIATQWGTLEETDAAGVITARLGTLSRVYHRDLDLFFKADTRVPVVSIEDSGGSKVVRISIDDRRGLWGKFLVTLTATQGVESDAQNFRVFIPMPEGTASGEPIPFVPLNPPTVEQVGLVCHRPLFKELGSENPFLDPAVGGKWHKFYWTRPGDEGPCTLIDLNINDGTYATTVLDNRELASTASQVVQVDDGIYFGSYYPPELIHCNLNTGVVTVIGQVWPNEGLAVFALDAGPNGEIAMGAPLGYVALWREGIGFTTYGPYGGNYAYDVATDGTWIYSIHRGDTWKWVAIPIATPNGAVTVMQSANADGFMNLSWDPNIPVGLGQMRVTYNGITYIKTASNTPQAVAPYIYDHGPVPDYPDVVFDVRSSTEEPSVATVHFKLAADPTYDTLEIPIDNEDVSTRHVFPLGTGPATEMVTISQGYGTIDAYNPAATTSRRIGLDDQSSVGSVAVVDDTYFAKGSYPGGNLARVHKTNPFTLESDMPGEPGTPHTAAGANPRWASISEHANDIGGIYVLGDGSAIVATLKQRYESGFELFLVPDILDPTVFTLLEYPDEITHLAMSWGILLADESKVLISTNIKEDTLLPEYPVPDEARIFRLDPVTFELDWIAPLSGVDNYGPFCQVGTTIVGASYDQDNPEMPRTRLFVADIATGALLNYRWYDGTVGPDKPGSETGIPRAGPTFTLGPDGFVWTASHEPGTKTVQRIHPETLEITAVVRLAEAGHVRIAFHGGYAYLTGYPRLARIPL